MPNLKFSQPEIPQERVTLKVLAAHLGLARGTISLVLNSSPGYEAIPEATRNRVIAAAAKMGYKPNFFARALNTKRTYMVAVLTSSLSTGYDTTLLGGVEERLSETDYLYVVASHGLSKSRLERSINQLSERGVEGLILINANVEHRLPPLPFVLVGSGPHVDNACRISMDNREGARLALQHLHELGHKRIAFFKGNDESVDTADRWLGVEQAAQAIELPIDRKLVFVTPETVSMADSMLAIVDKLVQTIPPFTAALCFNDASAISLMTALTQRGLSVPEQVSVVGFDDIPLASFVTPQLTTVRQPLMKIGGLAAEQLIARIEKQSDALSSIVLNPEFIVRRSSARARTLNAIRDTRVPGAMR